MVVRGHTMVARFAMLAAQWLLNVANRAILILYEQHHIVILFLIVNGEAIIELDNHIRDFLNAVIEDSALSSSGGGSVMPLKIKRRVLDVLSFLLDNV